MRNKLVSLILALVLLCTFALNLVGCGQNGASTEASSTPASTDGTEGRQTVPETSSETEPAASESEPASSATEPASSETQPVSSDTEPVSSETEPAVSETEPAASATEPVSENTTIDLMADFVPRANSGAQPSVSETTATTAANFAARLLKEAYDGNNTLLSPLSILSALAMTANGAEGETLSEMLNAFGVSSLDELNDFFAAYLEYLPANEYCKLSLANSIWFRDVPYLAVKDQFLQTNADYYRAGAYRSPFDNQTLNDINQWVNDNTDQMIDKILDEISPLSMLYLINALAFDAKWAMPYREAEQIVENGSFRKNDGTYATVTYLRDNEYRYLVDGDLAVGFSKPYADQRFAFVALRPSDGVTVEDYVATLTGEKIVSLLQNAKTTKVDTLLPKFESRYSIELSGVLSEMGMPIAFTEAADFTGITESVPLMIGKVLHKTFISVGEEGTRAAAATLVEMKCYAVAEEEIPPKVYLNRSFVYMLVDTETNFPFFIGVLDDPAK